MKTQMLISATSALLIILWVYAAGTKLVDHQVFLSALSRQPLPHWSVPILAISLPLTEIAVAIFLCVDHLQSLGFLLSLLLMVLFTLYVTIALSGAFGTIPCSCGGIISALKWKGHLLFNLAYTLVAWLGWRQHRITEKGKPKQSISTTVRELL